MTQNEPIRVLFVCLGNICRSPMAAAIFRHLVQKAGLSGQIEVDSAGIGSWHVGEPPHRGTQAVLRKHGISFEGEKARQIRPLDLSRFDYLVAMDTTNLRDLQTLARRHEGPTGKLLLLLDFAHPTISNGEKDVPDPYYSGNFDYTFDLIYSGCVGLLDFICTEHQLRCAVE
jgi:protein-tyrosine phosphatase